MPFLPDILRCDQCAGPIPLTDAVDVRCPSCGAQRQVPETHRLRARELDHARSQLTAAKERWDQLPGPLPSWLVRPLPALIIVGTPAWVVLNILGWAWWDWFPSGRHMLGWGIFTPICLGIFVIIDVMAARSTVSNRLALCALRHEDGWQCRACGAPVFFPSDSAATTCGYCGADNLITQRDAAWLGWVAQERAAAGRSLGETILAVTEAQSDRRLTRLILFSCLVPFWLLFCGPLIYIWFSSPGPP